MKFSLQATLVIGVLLALAAAGVAFTGFMSLGEITDPALHSDAEGYAWFWTFLAAVAAVVAALAGWMARAPKPPAGP
jgi:NADH:ubiquinone oxidoreductase subunit 5 (subunit L)/multisubunit Na+/H+ antiporter MnhA subunit